MSSRRLLSALAALALAAFAAGTWAADAGPVPKPNIVIEKDGQCVAAPEVMRREHMNMLKHQRDLTVHEGIRSPRHSLKGCIDCHASKANGAVVGTRENFCQSCHAYAAVKLDCFECHSAMPAASTALQPNAMEALANGRKR
ncbi:MAG: hypothetical protein WBP72_05225 [Rhodocyclaceae bacterium]